MQSLNAFLPAADAAPAKKPASHAQTTLTTPEPRTPLEHNNRGVELGLKGLWPQAIHEHELALTAAPDNKEFRQNLSGAQLRYGNILANKHQWYEAIKQYRGALYADSNNSDADHQLDLALKAVGKNPDDVSVRAHLAEDADVNGDYETAIVEYNKCVHMRDSGPDHALLGAVYLKAGKVVQAFNELKIAVAKTWGEDQKNELAMCHTKLGEILKEYAYIARTDGRMPVAMKRLLNAGIEYRRAVTLNPHLTDAIQGLIEVGREAVAINPNSYDNHMTLAAGYQLAGDFDHAKQQYEDCWKINRNNPTLPAARKSFYLAVVQSSLTSPPMMASTLQKIQDAISKHPNDAEMLYMYGRGKEQQGDKNTALTYYQKALAINQYVNPDLPAAISRVSGTSPPTTASPNNSSLAVKPATNTTSSTDSLLKYADLEKQLRDGAVDQAAKAIADMLQNNPRDGHLWLLSGNIHEKQGDLEQASVDYRQAAFLKDPSAEEALRQISTVRAAPLIEQADKDIADKNWVKASSSLHEALSIAPNLSSIHSKLANVLQQLGDSKEATKELNKAAELDKK